MDAFTVGLVYGFRLVTILLRKARGQAPGDVREPALFVVTEQGSA
jgi:hypothetical protein